jgi:hypothetical protein
MAKQRSKPTKAGRLRSYHSYVRNAHQKIHAQGATIISKNDDGSEKRTLVTKQLVKKHLKDMNKLQGGSSQKKDIREYMKKKNWKKVTINKNSSKADVRRALKNRKIYNEAKARSHWNSLKKAGSKKTLKQVRLEQDERNKEYEGVGGSW